MKVTHNAPPTSSPIEQNQSASKADSTKAAKTRERERTPAAAPGRDAAVEISDSARLMQKANEFVHAAPDVRAERVAALKKSIQDGAYQVDSGKIADRIIEEHLFGDFGKNHL